jgi:hypothetical protein
MEDSKEQKTFFKELQGTTDEIISQVRRLVKKGNDRRLMIVNKKGKILFQTQLTAGLAGSTFLAFMAPVISALGMFALVMNDVKLIIEKYPDEDLKGDEYEVEGEIIVDVDDEEDEGEEGEEGEKAEKNNADQEGSATNKTVGKDGN